MGLAREHSDVINIGILKDGQAIISEWINLLDAKHFEGNISKDYSDFSTFSVFIVYIKNYYTVVLFPIKKEISRNEVRC